MDEPANVDAASPPADADRALRRSKRANIGLWVLQVITAVMFLGAGVPKVAFTDDFIASTAWAADVPRPLLLFIGAMEILGAVGVILPRLTRIATFLTPLAGLGLATIMLLSIGFHFSRGEWNVGYNVVMGLLAGLVAYGRWKWAP